MGVAMFCIILFGLFVVERHSFRDRPLQLFEDPVVPDGITREVSRKVVSITVQSLIQRNSITRSCCFTEIEILRGCALSPVPGNACWVRGLLTKNAFGKQFTRQSVNWVAYVRTDVQCEHMLNIFYCWGRDPTTACISTVLLPPLRYLFVLKEGGLCTTRVP